jgi:hypothetical protein
MPVALLYICDSPYQIDIYLLHGVFKASQQGGLTYFSAFIVQFIQDSDLIKTGFTVFFLIFPSISR